MWNVAVGRGHTAEIEVKQQIFEETESTENNPHTKEKGISLGQGGRTY